MPHIHDKIDFTVSALIVYKNTVLLRKHDKYNILLGVGGHIELDEDPNQAVVREVMEEVGLTVTLAGTHIHLKDSPNEKDLIAPRFLNRHHVNPTHEHIDMVYFATTDSNVITQGENEKSEEILWLTKEELSDPKLQTKESIRFYALKALEELAS